MESCAIVANSTIRHYKRYEKRWWTGWLACGVSMTIALYLGLLARTRGEAIDSISMARKEMSELQTQQAILIENFVKAWQNQQATANALIGYGEYYQERHQLVDINLQASKEADKRNPWK